MTGVRIGPSVSGTSDNDGNRGVGGNAGRGDGVGEGFSAGTAACGAGAGLDAAGDGVGVAGTAVGVAGMGMVDVGVVATVDAAVGEGVGTTGSGEESQPKIMRPSMHPRTTIKGLAVM